LFEQQIGANQSLSQMPFDHPSWEPDEATKKRVLKQAFIDAANSDVCERHGWKKIISQDGTNWHCQK
jgi:hypothetical protein